MIADKIKTLRESRSMTQADLARMLNVSRSSINAWETGISTPSTKHLAELADIFKVTSDYMLEIGPSVIINADGLTDKDIEIVNTLIDHLRNKNTESDKK